MEELILKELREIKTSVSSIQEDVSELKEDVLYLNKGQVRLETKVKKLEQGQKRLEEGQKELKETIDSHFEGTKITFDNIIASADNKFLEHEERITNLEKVVYV